MQIELQTGDNTTKNASKVYYITIIFSSKNIRLKLNKIKINLIKYKKTILCKKVMMH